MSEYFDSIVVPVDFSSRTSPTLKQAYILAMLMNIDVALLYVYNKNSEEKNDILKKIVDSKNDLSEKELIKRELVSLSAKASEKYDIKFYPVITEGEVAESIVEFAKKNEARMIIMGNAGLAHIHNNKNLTPAIGSNTSQVIRKAECPVLTINSKVVYDIDSILVPVNLNKPIEKKLNWAMYFARYFGSLIKIISIINVAEMDKKPEYEEMLNNIKKELNDNNIFCLTNLLLSTSDSSEIGKTIVNYAKENECDLIITMTQEEDRNNKMFIGGTTTSVIKNSENPVLSVTPQTNTDI